MLGGSACLARQGFLDTAQDLLTQHRAAVGSNDVPSLQAQLRLRIAQVSAAGVSVMLQPALKVLAGHAKVAWYDV